MLDMRTYTKNTGFSICFHVVFTSYILTYRYISWFTRRIFHKDRLNTGPQGKLCFFWSQSWLWFRGITHIFWDRKWYNSIRQMEKQSISVRWCFPHYSTFSGVFFCFNETKQHLFGESLKYGCWTWQWNKPSSNVGLKSQERSVSSQLARSCPLDSKFVQW